MYRRDGDGGCMYRCDGDGGCMYRRDGDGGCMYRRDGDDGCMYRRVVFCDGDFSTTRCHVVCTFTDGFVNLVVCLI